MVTSKRTERLQARSTTSNNVSVLVGVLTSVIVGMFIPVNSLCVCAGDWPQINGPNRNGTAVGEKLLAKWPVGGLKEIWSHPVGQGNSGPAVANGKLIVFHRPAKKYLVEALDPKTGRLIWNRELPTNYAGGVDGDLGPKSVPMVHGGRVYLFGTGGWIFCLNLDEGSTVWQKNVADEYQIRPGYFGAGTSPIAAQGNLIVNVGGKNAAVVAFDLATGKEVWKSIDDDASYSSPITMEAGGEKIVVFVTRMNLVGLNPETGKVRFQTPFGKMGPTVNAAMPVFFQSNGKPFLFVNAAYGIGARLLKVSETGIEKVWGNDDSFSSQYSTPVFVDGNLFGTAGREDHNNGSYRCFDALTGKVNWVREGIPVGHSIFVDGRILVLDSDGGFHVIAATPSKFNRVYQTKLFDSKARALPAISDGLLYARSNATQSGRGELVCVRVGQSGG